MRIGSHVHRLILVVLVAACSSATRVSAPTQTTQPTASTQPTPTLTPTPPPTPVLVPTPPPATPPVATPTATPAATPTPTVAVTPPEPPPTPVPTTAPTPGGPVDESFPLLTNGAVATSTDVLAKGRRYRILVSGTFPIGGPGDGLGDAEYADFAHPPDSLVDGCDSSSGSFVDIGISLDGNEPDWGPYRDDHTYDVTYAGRDAPVTIQYRDCNVGDNRGDISVRIVGPQP